MTCRSHVVLSYEEYVQYSHWYTATSPWEVSWCSTFMWYLNFTRLEVEYPQNWQISLYRCFSLKWLLMLHTFIDTLHFGQMTLFWSSTTWTSCRWCWYFARSSSILPQRRQSKHVLKRNHISAFYCEYNDPPFNIGYKYAYYVCRLLKRSLKKSLWQHGSLVHFRKHSRNIVQCDIDRETMTVSNVIIQITWGPWYIYYISPDVNNECAMMHKSSMCTGKGVIKNQNCFWLRNNFIKFPPMRDFPQFLQIPTWILPNR